MKYKYILESVRHFCIKRGLNGVRLHQETKRQRKQCKESIEIRTHTHTKSNNDAQVSNCKSFKHAKTFAQVILQALRGERKIPPCLSWGKGKGNACWVNGAAGHYRLVCVMCKAVIALSCTNTVSHMEIKYVDNWGKALYWTHLPEGIGKHNRISYTTVLGIFTTVLVWWWTTLN